VNLSSARTQLEKLGAGRLSGDTTMEDYYLNQAKNWIEDKDDWPWLETTTTGSAPLTISDLRKVIYVADTTNDRLLKEADLIDIARRDPGIDDVGDPTRFYVDGLTSIKVWPVRTVALSVRYLKYSPELTTSDTPLIPARYHMLWCNVAYYLYLQAREPQYVTGDMVARINDEIETMKRNFSNRDVNSIQNLYGSVYDWYTTE
jgi:hypothetical protein